MRNNEKNISLFIQQQHITRYALLTYLLRLLALAAAAASLHVQDLELVR